MGTEKKHKPVTDQRFHLSDANTAQSQSKERRTERIAQSEVKAKRSFFFGMTSDRREGTKIKTKNT